jgi:DNA-binding transcriptional LysR family regulator
VGILVLPINDPELEAEIVSREPLWVAISPTHRLAGRERIMPEDLAEERILGLSAGSACGINLKIAEVLGRHGVDPLVHISDTYLRTAFVRTGLGVSIIPASVAKTMGEQVAFRPLCPVSYLDIAVADSRRNSQDAIMQHFFDAMRHASDFNGRVAPDR